MSALLALHGLPTTPAIWARLRTPMAAPALVGTLPEQVAAVLPMVTPETVLLGHDMGGVVAALVAIRVPVRAVILTGTALGPYWAAVRATALPVLWRPFYARHAGKRFVAGAVSPERVAEALDVFPGADPAYMRGLAATMQPGQQLARRLAAAAPVGLVWGRADRWYPRPVALAVARGTQGVLRWVDGGHFAMWEHPEGFDQALEATLAELNSARGAGPPASSGSPHAA